MLGNPINWLSAATDPDRNIKEYCTNSLGNSLSIWMEGEGRGRGGGGVKVVL
jgi:hypothetical protein